MLPDLTEHGLLPPGVHLATIDEFEQRFVFFGVSDRRFRLFDRLRELHDQARMSGIIRRFLVVGSFITSKPEPNDFDCILVLDSSITGHDLTPMEYNMVWGERARRIFGGDVFPVLEGSPKMDRFVEFFQSSRYGVRVGMVEIEL